MALLKMRHCSALLSLTVNVALLLFIGVEPSSAMPFKTVSQTVFQTHPGQGFSFNNTTPAFPVDWAGYNKSPEKTGQGNGDTSDGFFDDQTRKPRGGFGVAGDMVLPMFTLIDRWLAANTSLPITRWPLNKEQKTLEVSEDRQSSDIGNQSELRGASFSSSGSLSEQGEDEKTPPEDSGGHIHIGQAKNCPAPGCNNEPCRCAQCIQTTGQKRHQERASEVIPAKKKSAKTSALSLDMVEKTEAAQEQNKVRQNNLSGKSMSIVHALFRREATSVLFSVSLGQAALSQYLLQATTPIEPMILDDVNMVSRFTVLSTTRFIIWMGVQRFPNIWTEGESSWSSVTPLMVDSWSRLVNPISHDRFVSWTDDGSLVFWIEIEGEWTVKVLSDQAGIPCILTVLSDGQIVAVNEQFISIWTEVDGDWSSIKFEKGSENITEVLALRAGGFLTFSREMSFSTVLLWRKGEGGWTYEIHYRTTGRLQAGPEEPGRYGYEIEKVSVFDDGTIFLSITSVVSCIDNSGEDVGFCRFIQTNRFNRWVEFGRWRPELGEASNQYSLLTSGQIIIWKEADHYSEGYLASIWTEQPDGEWLSSGVIHSSRRNILQLKDGRFVSMLKPMDEVQLNISIKDKEKWSSVVFAYIDDYPRMFEIRAGLLVTAHTDGVIRLWDLYHPLSRVAIKWKRTQ